MFRSLWKWFVLLAFTAVLEVLPGPTLSEEFWRSSVRVKALGAAFAFMLLGHLFFGWLKKVGPEKWRKFLALAVVAAGVGLSACAPRHLPPPPDPVQESCPGCVEVPPTPDLPPLPTANLRGQFVIDCPGCPYGPRPGAADNVFFLAALDQVWDRDAATAEQILSWFIALGGNHIPAGPAFASGYHGQYPDDRWIGRADRFADYVEWVQGHGVLVSLWLLPDVPPYYDNQCPCFDWGAVERDLTPFYSHPRLQAAIHRTVYMWEDYQRSSEMVRGYDWMRRVFPRARRYWHNPPGHLSPGLGTGDLDEQALWRLAAAHGIHGLYLQAHPPGARDTARPPIDQLVYDLRDMVRRFRGVDSPWGAPILDVDGRPLEVVWAEGSAFSIYNERAPQGVGGTWAVRALSVDGVTDVLDGLPATIH